MATLDRRRKYARDRARRLREDPEYRKLELERNQRWREDNPEKIKKCRANSHKKWYAQNREAKLKDNRQWKRNNPEKVNEMARVHNSRRRAKVSGINDEIRAYLLIILCDPCVYCGGTTEHADHIVPLTKDGEHDWTNITSACARCNHSKHTKSLLEFLLCV